MALAGLAVLAAAGVVVAVTGLGRSSPTRPRAVAGAAARPAAGTSAVSTTTTSITTGTGTTGSSTNGAAVLPAWRLPAPARYQGVVGVSFPRTTLGALAMGYQEAAAQLQVDPSIAASVVEAVALHPTPALGAQVAQGIEALRAHYGITPNGPTADTISLSIEACRAQSVSPGRVVAGYEGVLVVQGPSIQGTTANYSFAVPAVWAGSDWKLDVSGASLPQPPIAFPGTPGASTDGWHPCSEG
ncbi:MAG: hypothetical protein M0Z30_15990 [Actinomycetota bacterium]|nr:hypothetical protein [Actinomycetota bacterium]